MYIDLKTPLTKPELLPRIRAVLEAVSRAHLYRKPVPEGVVLEARTLLIELAPLDPEAA
jgi:hypothetical protein